MSMIGAKQRSVVSEIVRVLLMVLFALFITVPFLWVGASGFKPLDRLTADLSPFSVKTFLPTPFTLEAMKILFVQGAFGQSILVTLLVGASTVVVGILINSMAGFSFAKFEFRGKNFLFVFVLISFLIPFEAITIPLYIACQRIGLLDTPFALVLPAVANGLCIFLFRQFFMGIPDDLLDSATIDGAGWLTIYYRIFLPLARSAAVTAGLLLFIAQWRAYIWPLLAVQNRLLRMVQVAISYFTRDDRTVFWNGLMAANFITGIIPLMLIFPFQKFYIRGITSSGIKG
jgi:multiple sugar transport system permease protein/putative chitobiose transport system permease protein